MTILLLQFEFYSRPFVYLTSLLITGILFMDFIHMDLLFLYLLLLSLIIATILLAAWGKGRSLVFSTLIFVSFLVLGGLLITTHRSVNEAPVAVDNKSPYSYMLQVDEINGPDRDWRKAICSIFSRVDSNSCTTHRERVLLFLKDKSVRKGDHLLTHTQFSIIKNKNNPGEFDARSFWNGKNIFRVGFATEDDFRVIGHTDQPVFQKFFSDIQAALTKILEHHLTPENASLAKALILGDKDMLSTEVRNSFSNAGAMHVLAVSGLHIGIVLYIIIFLLGRLPKLFSRSSALITALVIIWIYAGVTGFSPSVLRASFMFSLLAIGTIAGKRTNSMNILFFSAFVMLVIDPLLIYTIGFQLSYLAMIGIFTLYKPLSRLIFIRNKWLRKIWEGTAVGIAAQLFTVPFTLYYFHQFPNYFALTNIGMMLFAGLVLGIGMLLFALHWWSLAGNIVGVLLAVCLSGMLFFVQFVERLPGSVSFGFTPSFALLVFLYAVAILAVVYKLEEKLPIVSLAVLLLLFTAVQYSRYDNLYKEESILFNNNDFAMTIKRGDRILCLYNAEKEREKKTFRLFKDYQKVRPGKLEYEKLEFGETRILLDNDTLLFIMDKNGIEMNIGGTEFYVRTSYGADRTEGTRVIYMPYLESNAKFENLINGSIELNN